jgi:hypothetical protein
MHTQRRHNRNAPPRELLVDQSEADVVTTGATVLLRKRQSAETFSASRFEEVAPESVFTVAANHILNWNLGGELARLVQPT